MNLIMWRKPDGTELQTNDAEGTVAHCEKMEWKRVGGDKPMDEPQIEEDPEEDDPEPEAA